MADTRADIRAYLRDRQPSREELISFTEELSDEFLYCRRYGHNWHPNTATKIKGWYEAVVSCERCGCERLEIIDGTGEVVSKRMRYPSGYLAHGIGRIVGESKARLRLIAIERHLAGVEREGET